MLEWKVLVGDFNHKEISSFNVFDHYRFLDDCKKNAKKNAKDYAAFCNQLYTDLHYHYCGKCEWEVIVTDWPTSGKCEMKLDVYDQVSLNWDLFCQYVWSHAVELRRWDHIKLLTPDEVNQIAAKAGKGNAE